MKISTPAGSRTRRMALKVDGKKPRGWKEGDDVPQVRHAVAFDEHGNADVSDDTGRVLMEAHPTLKKGHNDVSPEPTSTED